jgi:alpha-tubulin suppressor-like RCC1 family protein
MPRLTFAVPFSPIPLQTIFINTGGSSSFSLRSDSTNWAWGSNLSGKLGIGSTASQCAPTILANTLTFRKISTTNVHTAAITLDGVAYSWGNNGNGRLGDNSVTLRTTPVQVCGGHTFCDIAAGSAGWTCALNNSGLAYCWGLNTNGQLGNNTVTSRSTPVAVCGGRIFS